MSTRVRCTLNYGGVRYVTMHQVVQTAAALYRQHTGRYYMVKKGTTPMWKYLMEMVEKIPDWPEGAKLKIWRERRGGKERRMEVPQGRTVNTVTATGHRLRFAGTGRNAIDDRTGTTGRFRNGLFYAEAPGIREEVPRAER